MRYSLLKAIFIYFILTAPINSNVLNPCSSKNIVAELITLNLDPDIKTNISLLNDLKLKYGSSIHEFLSTSHPYLHENPSGIIDSKTLQWTAEAIWNKNNPIARHMLIAADINNINVLRQYALFAFQYLLNSGVKTKLIFKTTKDFEIFKLRSITELKKIIKENNISVPDKVIKNSLSKFNEYYLEDGGHAIGFKSISYNNPVIVIDGHGNAGNTEISLGDVSMSSKNLIDLLISLKLPLDSTITLDSCLSACNKNKLPYSIAEIKIIFKQNLLTQYSGPIKNSFLADFSKKIFSEIPDFNGTVEGYIGVIHTTPQKNVYRKNGSIMSKGFATEVTGLDGSIFLKKEEVKVVITRSDIN